MADSPVVPDVESSAVRIAVAADLVDQLQGVATGVGLTRDELIELVLRSRGDRDPAPALKLLDAYLDRQARTPADITRLLHEQGINEAIRGLRLGPPGPDRIAPPWPRVGAGAALSWNADEVWPIARGLWRIRPAGVSVIAALRLGQVLGVYRVGGWVLEPRTQRHYAVDGLVITANGRLRDPETGADRGEATSAEQAIQRILAAAPIVMPPGRQPVVRLSDR